MRARSNSVLARPYIDRLSVFNRLICPSVWPLLHGSVTAFCTALLSWRNVFAKRRIVKTPRENASRSHSSSFSAERSRNRPLNRMASLRMVVNSSEPAFRASTIDNWRLVICPRGFTQRAAAVSGDAPLTLFVSTSPAREPGSNFDRCSPCAGRSRSVRRYELCRECDRTPQSGHAA